MLEYCLCPKCERLIMLSPEFATGFCLYCGTHIAYKESKDFFLRGLKSAVPDDLVIEADLSELIEEENDFHDDYGAEECRTECQKAKEYLGKWDFSNAFQHYSLALEYRPKDFEACCGKLTTGILKLKDVENWELLLTDCTDLIRSQNDWNTVQKSLEYVLDILKKFLSKGGRFVSPAYTYGFFCGLCEKFPMLRTEAAEIFAHCLNVDNAPFTDAARLDGETTRFAVGSYPPTPDKRLSRSLALVMKYHPDPRKRQLLIRALYVFDRAAWLRSHDSDRIDDVLDFLCEMFDGAYTQEDRKAALEAGYDFLLMGALEPGASQREKLLFLSGVYSFPQIKRMERFFSASAFYYRLYREIYIKQKGASPLLAEYRRLSDIISELESGRN